MELKINLHQGPPTAEALALTVLRQAQVAISFADGRSPELILEDLLARGVGNVGAVALALGAAIDVETSASDNDIMRPHE
jgi:hypothetical protein